jgi:tetratricopeptide (TPR) repeat protein
MAVNLIASRAETQAAGFVLAALFGAVLARDAHRSRRARLALGGSATLAAALAIGSKSVAVAVFPLWLLVTWFLQPPSPATRGEPVVAGRQGGALSVRAAVAACGVVSGCALAGLLLSGEVWQSRYHGPWANLCTQAPVVLRYAWLTLAPHRVSLVHDPPIRTGLDATSLFSMLALVAALASGAWLARRRDWLGCGLLGYLIAIAPSSSLIPRGEPMLEYRGYLATLGLAGALVYGVVRVGSWPAARLQAEPLRFWVPAGALAGWMIVLAAHTTAVNRAYGDALALWSRAARLAPGSYRAHHGYGRALYGAGRYAEAAEHYRRSIALEPGFPNNYWNLAAALAALNDLAGAERELRRGLAVAPNQPNALVNLGVIRRRLNDPGGAAAFFERALAVEPAHAEGNYNLADLLCEGGAFAAAARHYEVALRVRPSYAKALAGLATARAGMGDPAEAARLAERALAVDPNEATAHAALADAWAASNRHAEALATLERGLTRSPGHRLLTRKKGWLLAASPVPEQRDPAAAGRLAAMLVHASGGTDARELDLLAAAHAAAGRFDAAALTARRALGLLRRPEDEHLIRQITQRLQLYESRRPYLLPPTPPDSKTDEKKVAAEPIEKVQ